MIQVISKTLDYKTGLTGSEVLTGTALKYGAYQGFICQTYTVVAIVTNSKGDDITDLLGLRGVTLSPGIYICVPKGESIYSISLASGSVVLYGIAANIERVPTIAEIIDAFSSRVTTDGGTLESTSCINGSLVPYYKDASFVLIPSGYKALKAYAQKPITGNGDLTWSRNSVANRTQSNGNIGSVAANVPRLSYMYGSCPALLLEPQRTNLATYSQEFNDASWNKVSSSTGSAIPVITANATTAPDGTSTADLVEFTPPSDTDFSIVQKVISQTVGLSGTIYVKAFDSSQVGKKVGLYIVKIGDVRGTAVTLTNQWQRVEITRTADTFIEFTVGKGRTIWASGGISQSESASKFYIWGAQLEQGAYPTTYIPTTSATATRLADSFTRNNIYTNGLISASGGTWFVELRNNVSYTRDANNGIFLGDSTTINSGNQFTIRNFSSTGGAVLSIIKYISGTSTNIYTILSESVKIAIKWNGTSADVFANGVKVVSATAFTTTNMDNLIGSGAGVPVFIQAMALYPTPLSDATCIAMTQ